MAKQPYTIPNSTVGKKISARPPNPTSLVKGSKTQVGAKTFLSGGAIIKAGDVGKIPVPPAAPSPPAKK